MRGVGFLLRIVIALVLIAILPGFITTASAACGWVLWWEETWSSFSYRTAEANVPGGKNYPEESVSWNILGAYPTNEACESQQERKIRDMLRAWQKEKAEAKAGEHTFTHEPGSNVISQVSKYTGEHTSTFWHTLRYLCLPDTVDPRRK